MKLMMVNIFTVFIDLELKSNGKIRVLKPRMFTKYWFFNII